MSRDVELFCLVPRLGPKALLIKIRIKKNTGVDGYQEKYGVAVVHCRFVGFFVSLNPMRIN